MPRAVDTTFERMWAASGGDPARSNSGRRSRHSKSRHRSRHSKRAATKAAVGMWKAQQAGKTERKTQEWKKIHVGVRKRLAKHREGEGTEGVGAFLGQRTIGFMPDFEPQLLQRRGQTRSPPEHWSVERVEEQEQRDLVIIGRAKGTWQSYSRWWGLFSTHAKIRGHDTGQWRPGSHSDEAEMRSLLRKMVYKYDAG